MPSPLEFLLSKLNAEILVYPLERAQDVDDAGPFEVYTTQGIFAPSLTPELQEECIRFFNARIDVINQVINDFFESHPDPEEVSELPEVPGEAEYIAEYERNWAHLEQTITHNDLSTSLLLQEWFPDAQQDDAYGSAWIRNTSAGDFYLLNNYADHQVYPLQIATWCVITGQGQIEAAHVVVNLQTGKAELVDFHRSTLPSQLRALPVTTFAGKRAFYFDEKTGVVDLRCPNDVRAGLPRHLWSDPEYDRNVSGPRVKVLLHSVKEG